MILAAGLSTRYGGPKQLAPVGPNGEALLDYGIYDARRAGYGDVVLVIRAEQEQTFREHAARVWGDAVPARYAFQRTDQPAAPERVRPWGTAHAVLAAAPAVRGPFAVMNADDFYGASSIAGLSEFLASLDGSGSHPVAVAMVGYRLRETLSEAGGVSRGICRVNAASQLESVEEVRHISRGPADITGETVAGEPVRLSGDEVASMNLWGCAPTVFAVLGRHFARFLETGAARDPEAELLLADVVRDELVDGSMVVQVLVSRERWFGMTFPADRDGVVARLAELVSQGHYPDNLSAWFHAHGGTD